MPEEIKSKLPILNSKVTLRQMYNYTVRSINFKNRFSNRDRDVLKRVTLKNVKKFDKETRKIASTYYKIEYVTYSYPQYPPYTSAKNKVQRKYKHVYQGVLELKDLDIDSLARYRTGRDAKPQKAPKSQLKSVSLKDRERMKKKINTKYKDLTQAQRNKKYSEELNAKRKKGKYLNEGDFNGRKSSTGSNVNLDFYYRISGILKKYGALYGKYFYVKIPKKVKFPFLDKHMLRLLKFLYEGGIIESNRRVK